jgi:DNA replication protein DnaC
MDAADKVELMEELKRKCDLQNAVAEEDKREGIDCPVCKNKEHNFYVDEKKLGVFAKDCICVRERNISLYLRKSGLKYLERSYTFDEFLTTEEWQKQIKSSAIDFVNGGYKTSGFYIGGQVGSGKSHICTAIAISLMKLGIPCKYILWRDFMAEMKPHNNESEYNAVLDTYRTFPMLYVDDFLKAPNSPSDADLKLAYDLINGRSGHGLNTIISSEYVLSKIYDFEEALHSRIVGCTEPKYCLSIPKDTKKDQRLK